MINDKCKDLQLFIYNVHKVNFVILFLYYMYFLFTLYYEDIEWEQS